MAKEEFVTGMYDYVFKKIFGENKANFTYLVELITKEKFEGDMKYTNIAKMSTAKAKRVEADIIASYKSKDANKEVLIDLEAQGYDMGDRLIKRQIHYAAMFLADMYSEGTFYEEDRKVIIIFIHKKKLNSGIPLSKTLYTRYPEEKIYYDSIIYDLYIEEYNRMDFKMADENVKMIMELVKLLTTEDIAKYLNSKNKLLKEVAKTIMSVNKDREKRIQAIMEEKARMTPLIIADYAKKEGMKKGLAEGLEKGLAKGLEKGLAEGREKGLAEGREEQLKENILSLKKYGMNSLDIASALNIDINYVESITK